MIWFAENAFIAENPGRFSVYLGELLGKIADGIEADDGRDLLDRQTGMFQKTGGLHTALPIQKGDEGHAHFLAELMGQVIRMDGKFLGGILDCQIAVEIVLDIDDCLVCQRAQILIGLLLHQPTILLDDINAEGSYHVRCIQPLDL